MSTSRATELSELIRRKAAEFKELCNGYDEETASIAPSERWSPKEIVSHLCGPEGTGHMPTFKAFLEKDTPTIDIETEKTFFTGDRARMSFLELLAELDREYDGLAEFVAGLTEEQLNRKAHMPFLKDTPFGEYPTLADWARLIGEYHLGFHRDHMREVLETLGVKPESLKTLTGPDAYTGSSANV
jgi:hypothetical protein